MQQDGGSEAGGSEAGGGESGDSLGLNDETRREALRDALAVLAEGADASELSTAQWEALYGTFEHFKAHLRISGRLLAHREVAADEVLSRWLEGGLAASSLATLTPTQAWSFVRTSVYRRCIDWYRRESRRSDTPAEEILEWREGEALGLDLDPGPPIDALLVEGLAQLEAKEVSGLSREALQQRIDVMLGRTTDEALIDASLAAEPDPSTTDSAAKVRQRRSERLMKAQRRAISGLTELAQRVAQRVPPDPEGQELSERLLFLTNALLRKAANGAGPR